ncbi:hypothetical protein [Peptoniphilus sp.]|uniref:hypothetical protein n=1 Tax=Peptoniphilus sp. TaxID=1971214 RepID=UPI002A7FDF80|nr:hypothetical protein [Peptoniphilus sp.]MDY3903487.1 hypothetical protein [Peptoniphilus sp.]
MRKGIGIILVIIFLLSILLIILLNFQEKSNNYELNDENSSYVMSEEITNFYINNKNSNDLYRNVIISQNNDFYGKKLNSQFSFTLLLEKADKIKFKDPKDYKINFRLLEDKNMRAFYEYQILSEDFELYKDYQGIGHFRFYLTYSIREDFGKLENNKSDIYSLHGEINIEDI